MLTKYFLPVKNGDNCDANLLRVLSNRLINFKKLQEQWLHISLLIGTGISCAFGSFVGTTICIK
jgi:hypothetical protein